MSKKKNSTKKINNKSKKKIVSLILSVLAIAIVFLYGNPSESDIDKLLSGDLDTVVEGVIGSLDETEENYNNFDNKQDSSSVVISNSTYSLSNIPSFDGKNAYIAINNNEPNFSSADKNSTEPFETYSNLDNLGRCGVAYANICKELMPTEERGNISSVTPSGWKYNGKSNNNEYDTKLVDGGRIYNRCHLIGFQLAGENANKKNLVTGTRYLNIEGMLPFENMIDDYVDETNNHVLFRVTPIYQNSTDLVPYGVQMEAWSVEDEGDGICFNVFAYNVQPGIEINYATGENWLI